MPSPSKPLIVPRASAPAPVDAPTPQPTLRYAAAAAIAIPKPEHPAEVASVASSFDSQTINPSVMSRKPTLEKKASSIVQSPPVSQAAPGLPPAQVSAYAAQDPILPAPLPEPVESKMPPALADLVASFDSTKAKGIPNKLILAKRPDRSFVNSMVDLSFLNLPDAADSSK